MGTLKPYDPCPIEWMQRHNPRYTICEVIRDIFDSSTDEKIKTKARIAMTMAKKMNDRLIFYKDKMQEEEWTANSDEMKAILK